MKTSKSITLYEILSTRLYNHESEVQQDYSVFLEHVLNCLFVRKFNTDGYINSPNIKVLCEFKKNISEDLSKKKNICKCIIQALVYINILEREEAFIPEKVFIASELYYCFIDTKDIIQYKDIVSNETEASTAWVRHPDLMKMLLVNLNITINNVTSKIDLQIADLFLKSSVLNYKREIKTLKTLFVLLNEFINRNIIEKSFTTHQIVTIFLGILFDIYNNSIEENILNTTMKNNPTIKINQEELNNFLKITKKIKDPEFINEIASNKSILIDQLIRKYEGEFFTPEHVESLGMKYMKEFFGKKFTEEFMIHEPSSGLFQLTKKYLFKKLFCSTLIQEDIDLAKSLNYNPEAVAFQYDWLNDDCYIDTDSYYTTSTKLKIPQIYLEECKNYPLIILSNFPYGASGEHKLDGSSKDDISNSTNIHKIMSKSLIKFGKSQENLYTQCLYRCLLHKKYLQKDFYIACYTPLLFLAGPGFSEFRKEFFREFKLEKGFIVPASTFNLSNWPIMFGIYSSVKDGNQNDFCLDFYDENEEKKLIFKGNENIYNVSKTPREWIRENSIFEGHVKEVPIMASYIKVGKRHRKEYKDVSSKWNNSSFSLLVCDSNNIEKSLKSVYIINSGIRSGLSNIQINSSNFYHCVSVFSTRKVTNRIATTENLKKEFKYPDINTPRLKQFMIDSIIYSLFNNSSHQSSLKNVYSCNKRWIVENEFFWVEKEIILSLSKKYGNIEIYNDCTRSEERFVSKQILLNKDNFSLDAKNVLEIVNKMIFESFYKRNELNKKVPELNINNWDCGWKQIKKLFEYCNLSDIKIFNEYYDLLETRLLNEVFTLKFL
jgi:hypothetical protein